MPQRAENGRPGRAVLAAGAIIASLLAAGSATAAAAPIDPASEPRALPTWSACVGPALAGAGFADVSGFDDRCDRLR